MPRGFFSESQLAQVKRPMSMVPKCGACGFYKKCSSPKMESSGDGKQSILVIYSHPGKQEDKEGEHLVSEFGDELERAFRKAGVDLRKDCWITSALICKPTKESDVTNAHIDYCRPNVLKTIRELNPSVIILVGIEAVRSVIGYLWKDDPGGIRKWSGHTIPLQKWNCWVCPIDDPSYVMREVEKKNTVPRLLYEQHIAAAVELAGARPWGEVPDWKSEVEIILDTDKAARILRKMIRKGGTIAFDYEATCLKPEGKRARIVSCSVCWNGKKTIAFPWHGEAIVAMKEVLRSRLKKIAANLKYEDRTTRRLLRLRIRNWCFDTMIGAHAIDSREGTKSLKFQAFVRLGMESYNDHIESFLKSKGSMSPNRVDKIELKDLLLYNGLDSLLEFKLALVQMQDIGYPLPEGMKP